jgi:arsenate reductase
MTTISGHSTHLPSIALLGLCKVSPRAVPERTETSSRAPRPWAATRGFECAILCLVKKGKTATRAPERKTPFKRKKVLFFCACNSVRSQMAEGLVRALYGNRLEAFSAGLKPAALSSTATLVMAEIGIDISSHTAKSIEAFVGTKFDCVAMVCGDPKGTCPFLPHSQLDFTCAGCSGCCALHPFFPRGSRLLHGQFQNLIDREGTGHIEAFRRVRDEIMEWVKENFGADEG